VGTEALFRSEQGGKELSRNRVGAEYGKDSPIAQETSISETGIDFSSTTCAFSFFPNFYTGGIHSKVESI
jgi:hypothetical protein